MLAIIAAVTQLGGGAVLAVGAAHPLVRTTPVRVRKITRRG
jgi:hypothetical protein